jgi:haloalkane dehalogenase
VTDIDHAAGLAYRSAGEGDDVVLFVHGVPESSYMWRDAMAATADAGWRAIAPDLAGFGDSEPDPPGTWERQIEALDRFVNELGTGPVVLVTHDWGVMIGLRWACDHPGAARALVISDGGFFADRRWHDMANVMRTPGDGEELMRNVTPELMAATLRSLCTGMTDEALAEYWKCYSDENRRQGILDLYRSGDFDKLEPYEGKLAALGLPALILWGENDNFASPKMAARFHEQLAGSRVDVVPDAGHFVWEDAPERTTGALVEFLRAL